MTAILFFIWNLMMAVKRDIEHQADKSKPDCLGRVYSFEAYLIKKQSISVLPERQKNMETLEPPISMQKNPHRSPRTEWQIWCENNRMLFKSSA